MIKRIKIAYEFIRSYTYFRRSYNGAENGRILPNLTVNSQAIHSYVPQPYSGQITLFCAEEKSVQLAEKQIQGWSSLAMAGIDIHKIPGDHFSIVRSQVLVKKLKACLSQ